MRPVIALRWPGSGGDAVLIASDPRASIGHLIWEEMKTYPIVARASGEEVPIAIAGGAGDAPLVKQGFRMAEKVLFDLFRREWGSRTPMFEEFEDAVTEVERRLMARFRELREMEVPVSFQMVLGSVDPKGRASIYLFNDKGIAEPVHDNPGFAIIGSGSFTGGLLLMRLFGPAVRGTTGPSRPS